MIDYVMLEKYSKNKSVLLVEDDENILKETKELLELIFPYVIIAKDGKEGFEKYLNYKKENDKFVDLVITDIQMPILDGIELTKLIFKEHSGQCLIVLSAHSETHYLLELINLGISHFLTKPLNYDNFIHVLYTKLKDIKSENSEDIPSNEIRIDENIVWNKNNKQIYQNDEIVKLTKKESYLLEILLKYSEKTHSVEEILNYIWADDEFNAPDVSNLKNIISRLRKKLPSLDIENVYGFGYRINLKFSKWYTSNTLSEYTSSNGGVLWCN